MNPLSIDEIQGLKAEVEVLNKQVTDARIVQMEAVRQTEKAKQQVATLRDPLNEFLGAEKCLPVEERSTYWTELFEKALASTAPAEEAPDYRRARGILKPAPGSDPPEVIIRRMRDGEIKTGDPVPQQPDVAKESHGN